MTKVLDKNKKNDPFVTYKYTYSHKHSTKFALILCVGQGEIYKISVETRLILWVLVVYMYNHECVCTF